MHGANPELLGNPLTNIGKINYWRHLFLPAILDDLRHPTSRDGHGCVKKTTGGFDRRDRCRWPMTCPWRLAFVAFVGVTRLAMTKSMVRSEPADCRPESLAEER